MHTPSLLLYHAGVMNKQKQFYALNSIAFYLQIFMREDSEAVKFKEYITMSKVSGREGGEG